LSALRPHADHCALADPTQSLELVRHDGYAFVAGTAMRAMLARTGTLTDWAAFAASWNDLAVDTYMADRGRYRRRRHAVFASKNGIVERAAHQPHYQATTYNKLHGGIDRWFEPILPQVADGPTMRTVLSFCHDLFGSLAQAAVDPAAHPNISAPRPTEGRSAWGSTRAPSLHAWHVEVHQFRIEAGPGQAGKPTPEGAHRDGVDYVLVLLVDRQNIASGTTDIMGADRTPLGSFTLTRPFDAALVDDARVFHGVTPVEPIDPAIPAYRDVLVVTFRRA
jgi:hypothetical protein